MLLTTFLQPEKSSFCTHATQILQRFLFFKYLNTLFYHLRLEFWLNSKLWFLDPLDPYFGLFAGTLSYVNITYVCRYVLMLTGMTQGLGFTWKNLLASCSFSLPFLTMYSKSSPPETYSMIMKMSVGVDITWYSCNRKTIWSYFGNP